MQVISHTINPHKEVFSRPDYYSPTTTQVDNHTFTNEKDYNDYLAKMQSQGFRVGVKVSSNFNWKGTITHIRTYEEYKFTTFYNKKDDPDIFMITREDMTMPLGCGYSCTELTPL